MKNITLAIDEAVLARAREHAIRRGTTVNALVREHLADLVRADEQVEEARRGLLELIDNSTGRLGPNFKWNREEIYGDRLFPGHKRARLRRDGETG